jgi:hypothetical protein
VLRMNTDGTVDASFGGVIPCTNLFSGWIAQIEEARGGKIYVSGMFVSTSGPGTNLIVRLEPDGTIDSSFNPRLYNPYGAGPADGPLIFALQADGEIVVTLQSLRSLRHQASTLGGLIRLNGDGTLDGAFGTAQHLDVLDLQITPDGKLLVAGGGSVRR